MRTKLSTLLLVAAAGCGLSGCTFLSDAFGFGKHPPDEFQVVTHPPLEMPPNDDLAPPQPGAPRPQEESAPQLAEAAVLQTAGVAKADPKIRQLVNAEAQAESDAIKNSLYNKIIFWQTPAPPG